MEFPCLGLAQPLDDGSQATSTFCPRGLHSLLTAVLAFHLLESVQSEAPVSSPPPHSPPHPSRASPLRFPSPEFPPPIHLPLAAIPFPVLSCPFVCLSVCLSTAAVRGCHIIFFCSACGTCGTKNKNTPSLLLPSAPASCSCALFFPPSAQHYPELPKLLPKFALRIAQTPATPANLPPSLRASYPTTHLALPCLALPCLALHPRTRRLPCAASRRPSDPRT